MIFIFIYIFNIRRIRIFQINFSIFQVKNLLIYVIKKIIKYYFIVSFEKKHKIKNSIAFFQGQFLEFNFSC